MSWEYTLLVLLAFVVSVGFGHVAGAGTLRWFRRNYPVPVDEGKEVPPFVAGIIERIFFTIMIGYQVGGAGVAMIAWLGAKMAANWNIRSAAVQRDHSDNAARRIRVWAYSSLVSGLVSMLFALIGGLILAGAK